ncbi:MAG: hypothetical protein CMK59_13490 [Proteobacteria bacterium]|nr:hypothetical protein [Pseudomonadota bacterium]
MLLMTLIFACKDPIDADSVEAKGGNTEAPTDLNALTAYMFREWDNDDPSVLAAGLENIESIGSDYPVDESNFAERSFEGVEALTTEDVSDVELTHGYNPSDAGGVGIFLQSTFSVDDHVGLFVMADQTSIEPASPYYARTITDGETCFPSQACDTMASENDVERKNLVVDTEHETIKVWRWIELSDGRMAISGRTWQPALADSDKEDKIYQNYSIEVWIPNDDGTLRFLTTWSENSFEFADALIIGSVNDALEACDEFLSE